MKDNVDKICIALLVASVLVYCWGCGKRNKAYDEGYTDAEAHYTKLMDEMQSRLYWYTPEDLDGSISEMSREEIVEFYYWAYQDAKESMRSISEVGRDDSYSPSWKSESDDGNSQGVW